MVLIGDAAMVAVNGRERQLLEKIAAEGKATKIAHDELRVAKVLEGDGLLFLVGDDKAHAVITPKGRRLLAGEGDELEGATVEPTRITEAAKIPPDRCEEGDMNTWLWWLLMSAGILCVIAVVIVIERQKRD